MCDSCAQHQKSSSGGKLGDAVDEFLGKICKAMSGGDDGDADGGGDGDDGGGDDSARWLPNRDRHCLGK